MRRRRFLSAVGTGAGVAVAGARAGATGGSTEDLRILLNYYHGGELLAGAFERSAFESRFEAVGHYNRPADPEAWSAFDVVVTNFGADRAPQSLSERAVDAYRSFLADGGGLVVTEGRSANASNRGLSAIDPGLANDGSTREVDGGVVATAVPDVLATGGEFDEDYDAFAEAVSTAGRNRAGDRSQSTETYYGEDTTLEGDRLTMVVDASRAEAYRSDLDELEAVMANIESFLGIEADGPIEAVVTPMALESGVFAWGVADHVENRTAHARPPGHVRGIFEHECAHVYEFQFYDRYFPLPGFGVGIVQSAAGGDADWGGVFDGNGEISPKRSLYLWEGLIYRIGPDRMSTLYASLDRYDDRFVPGGAYWRRTFEYPEDGTTYLQRASSVIAFYVSQAFGRNFTPVVRSWGFDEVVDWEPVWRAVRRADSALDRADDPDRFADQRAEMYRAFHEGRFDRARTLAEGIDRETDAEGEAPTPMPAAPETPTPTPTPTVTPTTTPTTSSPTTGTVTTTAADEGTTAADERTTTDPTGTTPTPDRTTGAGSGGGDAGGSGGEDGGLPMPGFGVGAGLAGLGLGAWRLLRSEDRDGS